MEDYPHSLAELERRFATDEACRRYLADLRWPTGFRCPRCGGGEAWSMGSGLRRCRSCEYKLSLTAGTVFEGTRKPLLMWFRAIWLAMVSDASQKSLAAFAAQTVEPGGAIRTDDWAGYNTLRAAGYRHLVAPSHELRMRYHENRTVH